MSTTQQRLNEIAEQEKKLANEKAKLLAESKEADLELVKKLCKQHGFTATQLKSSLKTKGKGKASTAGAEKKPAAKKAPSKKEANTK